MILRKEYNIDVEKLKEMGKTAQETLDTLSTPTNNDCKLDESKIFLSGGCGCIIDEFGNEKELPSIEKLKEMFNHSKHK